MKKFRKHNLLCKALLGEAGLAFLRQLAQAVGVPTPVTAFCNPTHLKKLSIGSSVEYWCHPLVRAPGPLCVLGLREVNLEGTCPVRPGASRVEAPRSVATVGTRRALVIVSWTTIGVSPEDAAASSQVGSPARCCPGMFQAGAGGAAVLEVGLLSSCLEVVAVASDVRLVGQPGAGVRDRQAGVWVFHLDI